MRDLEIAALFAFGSVLVGLGVVFLGWLLVNWLDDKYWDYQFAKDHERLEQLANEALEEMERKQCKL